MASTKETKEIRERGRERQRETERERIEKERLIIITGKQGPKSINALWTYMHLEWCGEKNHQLTLCIGDAVFCTGPDSFLYSF